MHHFQTRNGVLHCEDCPLPLIAEAVGTPVYVYSSATLLRHVAVFREAFAPRAVHIAFAVKANANTAVLATLAGAGVGADTVSAGEIRRALAAGIPAGEIIFSGVGKTEAELAFAIEAGLRQINVESPDELAVLARLTEAMQRPVHIAIRVNPDIGAGAHDKISTGGAQAKFGVGPQEALALYAAAAAAPFLQPVGLAVHIGSQIHDLGPLEAAFRLLRSLTETLRGAGHVVTRLDLGGGLGVPYFNEPEPPSPAAYAQMIDRVMDGLKVDLSFEPGRLIAANAGVLMTRVIRTQPRAARPILVVDAAMNDLVRPAMYEAYHEFAPVIAPAADAPIMPTDIVGPICETGDTFARDRPCPPLAAGDLAVFFTAGAYGAVMSSTYNARDLVPEVLVRGGQFAVVRARFDLAMQLGLERLPPWAGG